LGAVFSNALIYGYSISPAQGQAASARVSGYPRFLFSSGNLLKAGAGWQGFLSLPLRNHVLAGRAALSTAFGDSALAACYQLGGPGGAFKLRGFLPDSSPTSRILSAGVEYRFPLFRVDHGAGLFPLFLNTISGALFAEAGAGWSRRLAPKLRDFKADAGAELKFDCVIGYLVPVSFQVGVARGFGQNDPFQGYAGANSSLLEELLDRKNR
jgi:hypothetical protein